MATTSDDILKKYLDGAGLQAIIGKIKTELDKKQDTVGSDTKTGTNNGHSVSVTTTGGVVTAVSVSAPASHTHNFSNADQTGGTQGVSVTVSQSEGSVTGVSTTVDATTLATTLNGKFQAPGDYALKSELHSHSFSSGAKTGSDKGVQVTVNQSAGSNTGVTVSVNAETLAASLGLTGAMHFIGKSATAEGGNAAFADVATAGATAKNGDVVSDKNGKEWVYANDAWIELGSEGSYVLKGSAVTDNKADQTLGNKNHGDTVSFKVYSYGQDGDTKVITPTERTVSFKLPTATDISGKVNRSDIANKSANVASYNSTSKTYTFYNTVKTNANGVLTSDTTTYTLETLSTSDINTIWANAIAAE